MRTLAFNRYVEQQSVHQPARFAGQDFDTRALNEDFLSNRGRPPRSIGEDRRQLTDEVGRIAGKIECQERLGGLLKYYHRKAA